MHLSPHSAHAPLLPTFRFFFSRSADPRDLPSFPTRRSSDLDRLAVVRQPAQAPAEFLALPPVQAGRGLVQADQSMVAHERRSEEHTSELQSRRDLVCRLLLEKKKKTQSVYTRATIQTRERSC